MKNATCIAVAVLLAGCSSHGELRRGGETFRFDEGSAVREEGGQIRVLLGSHKSEGIIDVFPAKVAGLQILLPANARAGGVYTVPDEAPVWLQGLGDSGWFHANWHAATAGTVEVKRLDAEPLRVSGSVTGRLGEEPFTATFSARKEQ